MKHLLKFVTLIAMILVSRISVLANDAKLDFSIDGGLAAGNMITLELNIGKISNLYAGSFSIQFDEDKVKVLEVKSGGLLENSQIQEVQNLVDNETNSIRYAFTCLANSKGISGSGDVIKIKLSLKDDEITDNIFKETTIKLIEQEEKELDYFDISINYELNESTEDEETEITPTPKPITDENNSNNLDDENESQNNSEKNESSNSTSTEEANNNSSVDTNSTSDKIEVVVGSGISDNLNPDKDSVQLDESNVNDTSMSKQENSTNNIVIIFSIFVGIVILTGIAILVKKKYFK